MKLPWKLPLVVGGSAKPASAEGMTAYRRDPARLADEVRLLSLIHISEPTRH